MIPDKLFTNYETTVDAMINELGVFCKLIYPAQYQNSVLVPAINTIKTMRPYESSPDDGFIHNGSSVVESEQSDTIKMRAYWSPKDFKKMAEIVHPDCSLMTIGFMSDFQKVLNASCMRPTPEMGASYTIAGQPVPWGLRKSRYFVAFWKNS